MDGSKLEFPREDSRAVLPWHPILQSSCLKVPFTGILYYRGEVFPVVGPIDESEKDNVWLFLAHDHARMIYGLPEFPEDRKLEAVPAPQANAEQTIDPSIEEQIAKELEELQKSA